MQRREFLMSSSFLAGASVLASAPGASMAKSHGGTWEYNPKGELLDLSTPEGNREALARLLGNTNRESTKFGWAEGIVQGIRPGEAIRDLVGFTMISSAKFLPSEDGVSYPKVLREVGLYTDLETGRILEEWVNPYLNEKVKVIPIANDPFNHVITQYVPQPPAYGGLNKEKREPVPLQLNWVRRGDTLNLMQHINLFYPSALQPAKWPRESGHPFSRVTEMFLYQIPWADMQNPKLTSVEYGGTWGRTTPWFPWMLMGPTPGHCQYHTFMAGVDDLSKVNQNTLDYVADKYAKYLKAPEEWEEPSLSSLEWYARERQPAPVPEGQPIPRAPDPELPAWFKAIPKDG